MSLTAADVAEIMRLVEESAFDELDLEMNGVKLTLRRAGAGGVENVAAVSSTGAAASDAAPSGATAPGAASIASIAASGPLDANLQEIVSPMLGTFYRAPKPGSAPFVAIGSVVEEDSVIAIIEVMKLMNTVRAGVKGVITEILPADEALVEFGQVLMRTRKVR